MVAAQQQNKYLALLINGLILAKLEYSKNTYYFELIFCNFLSYKIIRQLDQHLSSSLL